MQVGRLQATSGLAVVEVENSLDHIGIGEQGKHCLWIRYVGRRMAFTHGPVRADLIQVNAGDAGTTPQHLGHTIGGVECNTPMARLMQPADVPVVGCLSARIADGCCPACNRRSE